MSRIDHVGAGSQFLASEFWTIYCHTNRDTNMSYVGLTSNYRCRRGKSVCLGTASDAMEFRWSQHLSDARRRARGKSRNGSRRLIASILSHGASAFDHRILETGIQDLGSANAAEERWIALIQCVHPLGYNLTSGGRAGSMTEETKKILSASVRHSLSVKYSQMTDEQTRARRAACSAAGLKQNPDSKRRLFLLTDPQGKEHTVFGLASFCVLHDLSRPNMLAVAAGRRPSCKGWRCIRVDSRPRPPVRCGEQSTRQRQAIDNRKATYHVVGPTGMRQTIAGLSEFCRKNGLSVAHMSAVACGNRRHHKGWTCKRTGDAL